MFNVQVAFFPLIINIFKNPVLYFSVHLIALWCPAPQSIRLACDLLHSSALHKRCSRLQKSIKINFSSFALSPWICFVHTCVSIGLLCGSAGKESTCNMGDLGLILGWEDPLEKETTPHSSIMAWRIPWTVGLPLWLSWYRIHQQCERPRFDPWVGKILWRRELV